MREAKKIKNIFHSVRVRVCVDVVKNDEANAKSKKLWFFNFNCLFSSSFSSSSPILPILIHIYILLNFIIHVSAIISLRAHTCVFVHSEKVSGKSRKRRKLIRKTFLLHENEDFLSSSMIIESLESLESRTTSISISSSSRVEFNFLHQCKRQKETKKRRKLSRFTLFSSSLLHRHWCGVDGGVKWGKFLQDVVGILYKHRL